MKKYCLSDCAKRKLSAGKKVLVEFVTAISFIGLIVVVGFTFFTLVGLITQGIFVYFKGNLIGLPHEVLLTGLLVLMVIAFIGSFLLLAYLLLNGVYSGIKAVVTNKIVSEDYFTENCKIFVECKEVADE